jgi:diaminopimelate epimerase
VHSGLRFTKGHGTENDFVLLPDPDAQIDLAPRLVAALSDRRAGIGADGVIRVVRCSALPDGVAQAGEATWFMDYRNADGSVAEMCGNGVRVLAAYLLREGLDEPEPGGTLAIGSRAGVVEVRVDGDLLAARLGTWRVAGGEAAVAAGGDVTVHLAGTPLALPGLSVDVGNPHVVLALPDRDQLAAADLGVPPTVEPAPPEGANVEVVHPVASEPDTGHLLMRVHERGVGETRSCGSGAIAAAVAARVWAGTPHVPDLWWVDVPGGRLRVRLPSAALVEGGWAELAGPARLVADGVVPAEWLAEMLDEAPFPDAVPARRVPTGLKVEAQTTR